MTSSQVTTRIAVLLGMVLLVVGFVLGVQGVKVTTPEGATDATFSCGSAFGGDDDARVRADVDAEFGPDMDRTLADCQSKRRDRQTLAFILLGVGLVVMIGVPVAVSQPTKEAGSPARRRAHE